MKQALKFIGFIFDSIKIIIGVFLIAFIGVFLFSLSRVIERMA